MPVPVCIDKNVDHITISDDTSAQSESTATRRRRKYKSYCMKEKIDILAKAETLGFTVEDFTWPQKIFPEYLICYNVINNWMLQIN